MGKWEFSLDFLHLLHLHSSIVWFWLMYGRDTPVHRGFKRSYFSSSRESYHPWSRCVLCRVKDAGQDRIKRHRVPLSSEGGCHCLYEQEPDLEGGVTQRACSRWAWPNWTKGGLLTPTPTCSNGWEIMSEWHQLDLRIVAMEPEVLIMHSWWKLSSLCSSQSSSVAVFSADRPNIDILHKAFSLDWGFRSQRDLNLGSWGFLLLWMDILWFLSEF